MLIGKFRSESFETFIFKFFFLNFFVFFFFVFFFDNGTDFFYWTLFFVFFLYITAPISLAILFGSVIFDMIVLKLTFFIFFFEEVILTSFHFFIGIGSDSFCWAILDR